MRFRTFHNRIERREFEFDRADLLRLLKADVSRYTTAPPEVVTVTWDFVEDRDDETGELKAITLSQVFEYVSPATASVEASRSTPEA